MDELRVVAVAADHQPPITTCGFPTAIAALCWIDEVVSAEKAAPVQA